MALAVGRLTSHPHTQREEKRERQKKRPRLVDGWTTTTTMRYDEEEKAPFSLLLAHSLARSIDPQFLYRRRRSTVVFVWRRLSHQKEKKWIKKLLFNRWTLFSHPIDWWFDPIDSSFQHRWLHYSHLGSAYSIVDFFNWRRRRKGFFHSIFNQWKKKDETLLQ